MNALKRYITREKRALKEILAGLLLVFVLAMWPTGYEDAVIYQGAEQVPATVLETDESAVISTGLIKSGEQYCKVLIEKGIFKGQTADGINLMSGSLESDKIFSEGDRALVTINHKDGEILSVNMVDHYRVGKEAALSLIFVALLVLFAGLSGIRAVISFAVMVLSVWKIMIPCFLKGYDPIWTGLMLVLLFTVVIIIFVYGVNAKSASAILGSMLGVLTAAVLGVVLTDVFMIHGAVMESSESLLYSGYAHLDLTRIFMAGIFIGASGAMIDLAVDITSGVYEVFEKRPDISVKELTGSGLAIGRAAMGTMTATLLLAYSGGYLSLLMVFMAQGTPLINILNYKYVSAEILHTLVGCFGLVAVAPFTAFISAAVIKKKAK